jgi:hypothetical protein
MPVTRVGMHFCSGDQIEDGDLEVSLYGSLLQQVVDVALTFVSLVFVRTA